MCVIVSAHIPASQFALCDTLEREADVTFELLQHVARQSGELSLVWAYAPSADSASDLVADDSTVADVEVLTTVDGASLLRLEWDPSIRVVISDVVGTQGTVTSASATASGWDLTFLYPDRESVTATHDACERHGVDIELRSIRALSGSRQQSRFDLTESQHETLIAAHEMGYYNVPRDVKLAELAGDMGVSHQTLSERLRRGHRSLVGNALVAKSAAPHVEIE